MSLLGVNNLVALELEAQRAKVAHTPEREERHARGPADRSQGGEAQ